MYQVRLSPAQAAKAKAAVEKKQKELAKLTYQDSRGYPDAPEINNVKLISQQKIKSPGGKKGKEPLMTQY
jgi:hypothetical protein